MYPSKIAIGICSQTGKTDDGYMLNIIAIIIPKMEITIHSSRKTIMKNKNLVLLLMYLEVYSEIDFPLFLNEITSDPKS